MGREVIMEYVLIGLIGWMACGVVGYGITLAYFQRKFPSIAEQHYWDDVTFALLIGAVGPIGLGVSLARSNKLKYGFKWK